MLTGCGISYQIVFGAAQQLKHAKYHVLRPSYKDYDFLRRLVLIEPKFHIFNYRFLFHHSDYCLECMVKQCDFL